MKKILEISNSIPRLDFSKALKIRDFWGFGGAGGIRTLDTLLAYTHFPGVRLQPLGHPSEFDQPAPESLAGGANLKRRTLYEPPSGRNSAAMMKSTPNVRFCNISTGLWIT